MSLLDPVIVVPFVVFISALFQAAFGFGNSIISMPILVLVIGTATASPLIALVSVVLNLAVVIISWKAISWGAAWRLLVTSTLATPLGVYLLLYAPENIIKLILGIILLLFGIYFLLPLPQPKIEHPNLAYPFGFFAGILGSAYNINGPPVILFARLSRWSPERFRATLGGFFFPSAVLVALGHWAGGLWTKTVGDYLITCAPAALLGVFLGTLVNRRIHPEKFSSILNYLMIGMGILMLVTTR